MNVGFQPVGIRRRSERGNDGVWHDALLMDLLAEELTGDQTLDDVSVAISSTGRK